MLLPTGAGQPREFPRGSIDGYDAKGSWFHDGKRVTFSAHLPGKPSQVFLQDLSRGDPRPISPDALVSVRAGISPDDAQILAYNAERTLVRAPISGGPPEPVLIALAAIEEYALEWVLDEYQFRSKVVHPNASSGEAKTDMLSKTLEEHCRHWTNWRNLEQAHYERSYDCFVRRGTRTSIDIYDE